MTIKFIELLNLPINYNGTFTDCEIDSCIEGDLSRTKCKPELFQIKRQQMNEHKVEELRDLLNSKFNNDIELLARTMGISSNELSDFINGKSDLTLPDGFGDKECSQFVGKIEGDQIFVANGGLTKNYSNTSLEIEEAKLSVESSILKKLIKEKDATIKALYDEIALLKRDDKSTN